MVAMTTVGAQDSIAPVQLAVQVTVGTELVPVHEPMKPNAVVALAARVPFHAAFEAVTVEPLLVSVELHDWLTAWPFAYVQVVVQRLIAVGPALTVTSPWNPPCH
jgi:hypothetical protein